MNTTYQFSPIAHVESPYKEKFAIPRQPGIVSAAQGKIIFNSKSQSLDMVRGLAQFSHIWVLFAFHATQDQGWKPLVRPPRLGGNKKIGVLATRSTFRPNPIGMSVVKLEQVIDNNQDIELHISGLDLLDGTPVFDIKPYIPYSDSINDADAGFAQQAPVNAFEVELSEQALSIISANQQEFPHLKALICQVLAQDPRPAYKQKQHDDKTYGVHLYDFNIYWKILTDNVIIVTQIEQLPKTTITNS